MMSSQWQIFVEGSDDQAFLNDLLQHLNISNAHTSIIGGGVASLPKIANEIRRAYVNSPYWNLDAPALESLKQFLRAL